MNIDDDDDDDDDKCEWEISKISFVRRTLIIKNENIFWYNYSVCVGLLRNVCDKYCSNVLCIYLPPCWHQLFTTDTRKQFNSLQQRDKQTLSDQATFVMLSCLRW